MRTNNKGFWLLVLAAICLLLTSWLPAHHKLWFVSETGNVGHNQTFNLVLVILLFAKWQPVRKLIMLLSGLQLLASVFIVWWSWKMGEQYASAPYLGYSLTTVLHLVVLKVLNDSAAVREFLEVGAGPAPARR
ncbi:hypothetical protein MON38_18685 [Hymenobacter sp. DH14]|uniref:Uncharacterized protein n=1 Tax=Hymenobacter cyanobacteriorum TaxID=2926463 RepID=A0A9X1VHU7_9BACT|nr:hypothetical protein [Hymenobacter cyanobacteriorum]MCI1189454.1 hypothetical protein [Hymenobacter cyanobacteriorum]